MGSRADPVMPASDAARRRGAGTFIRSLGFQVTLAMVAGALLGHLWPAQGAAMQPLGDAFIRAIRMLIAPVVFCTVVHGIASVGDLVRVGRVALKALVYFEAMTTIALAIGLGAVNLLHPGVGMHIDATAIDTTAVKGYIAQSGSRTATQFLLDIIPNTLVSPFADGNVLQVLLVAILVGFALGHLGTSCSLGLDFIERVTSVLFGCVALVMRAAPLGAFGAIAFTVGRYGAGSLWSLGKLLLGFYATCLVFIVGVLGPTARLCGFRLTRLLWHIRDELLIVLATTSSETVLPRMVRKLQDLGCAESVVGLVIPTGYSFNLDGTCLYLATAAVFLAQATDTPLDLGQQLGLMAVLLLTSKGAAGVAGAAFVVLAATLSSAGTIPVASVALVLGIHRLMSEALTPTNLIGNAVATIIVAKWEGALDEDALRRALGTE